MGGDDRPAKSQGSSAKKLFGFCFAIACFFLFKWLFGTLSHGETLDPQFRANFTRAAIESCLKAQIAASENKDLTAGQLTKYCVCMANAELNDFSEDDYKTIHAMRVIPPAIQKRIDAMAPACVAEIVKELQK